jgi:hypothetical protein
MRLTFRQICIVALLTAAALVAGTRIASAQTPAVNPSAIEFVSSDHTNTVLVGYRVCFYGSATSTTSLRCNDVPKAQAVLVSATTYRLPRATWVAGLANATNYWPRVSALGTTGNAAEVAPLADPFSFRLEPAPQAVTDVKLIP